MRPVRLDPLALSVEIKPIQLRPEKDFLPEIYLLSLEFLSERCVRELCFSQSDKCRHVIGHLHKRYHRQRSLEQDLRLPLEVERLYCEYLYNQIELNQEKIGLAYQGGLYYVFPHDHLPFDECVLQMHDSVGLQTDLYQMHH